MHSEENVSNKSLFKVLGVVVVVLTLGGILYGLRSVNHHQGYAPEQPIPFSHKRHAGQYSIPCMYCHSGVEKSRHATIPSMNVCMNCHSVVKPESPHIQKLKQYVNEKRAPIEWIKVHDMPDFVFFNHKRHLAKGIACESCHGDVKKKDRIRQDTPMTMGWCIDCHRGKTAPDHLFEKGASGERGQVAPTNCYTCHH